MVVTTCQAQEEHLATSTSLAIGLWNQLDVLQEVIMLCASPPASKLHQMLVFQLCPRCNTTPHWYNSIECTSHPN